MVEETASPVDSGKAFKNAAEAAFDEIAEREGLDEAGDPVEEDDAPLIADDGDDEPLAAEVDDAEGLTQEDDNAPVAESGVELTGEEGDAGGDELLAPHTWSAEWKQAFAEVPPAARKVLLEQNTNMNRAFTNKMTELANVRKETEGLRKSVTPHTERLQRAGIAPAVAVERALAWDAHMQKDPVQGISDYAKAYGIDLAQVKGNQDEEITKYMTPTERALYESNKQRESEVAGIKSEFQQFQEHQQRQAYANRQRNAHAMLTQFMNAKDNAGNPLHPYIEHVAPMMTDLIKKDLATDLDDAYEKATLLNPEVRAALLNRRKADPQGEKKRQVEKVRKASSSGIVAKRGTKGRKEPRSTEDQVLAAYHAVRG